MKTEKVIRKQLDNILNAHNVKYDYRKTYVSVLNWVNWVLEEE